MNKGWLIWYDDGWGSDYGQFMMFLDEVEALEVYMALCEEELYEAFAWMTQDDMDSASLEEKALYVKLTTCICWNVKEVPVYGNFSC